jgi:hypothetical protein
MVTSACNDSMFVSSLFRDFPSDSTDGCHSAAIHSAEVINARTLIDEHTKEIEMSCNADAVLNQDDFSKGTELHDLCTDQFFNEIPSHHLGKRMRIDEESEHSLSTDDECLQLEPEEQARYFDYDYLLEHEFSLDEVCEEPESNVEPESSVHADDSRVHPQVKVEGVQATNEHATAHVAVSKNIITKKPKCSGDKEDNRGKHWATKVVEGKPPKPWKDTQAWADRRKAKEAEFDALVSSSPECAGWTLPWRTRGSRPTGNTQKVLYIELMMHRARGSVELHTSAAADAAADASFFGITRVVVPAAGRAAFDGGAIPSCDAHRRTGPAVTAEGRARLKALSKIWETAGFRERALVDGSLQYAYDAAIFAKQKRQQTNKRARAA